MAIKYIKQSLFSLLILSVALPVSAHTGISEGTSLQHGLLHPLTGLDHLLVLLAVGAFAFQRGGQWRWQTPLIFLLGLFGGALLVVNGLALPGMEGMIALSVLLLGALLTANPKRLPLLVTTLIASFAVYHGYAHATEAAASASMGLYLFGICCSSALVLVMGVLLAACVKRLHSPALRWGGMGISMTGILLMLGV